MRRENMDKFGNLDKEEIQRIEEMLEERKRYNPQIPGLPEVTGGQIVDLRETLINVVMGSWGGRIWYSDAERTIRVQRDVIGEILGVISNFEKENGRPLLSAVVVHKKGEIDGTSGAPIRMTRPADMFFIAFLPEARTEAERIKRWIVVLKKLKEFWGNQLKDRN